MAGVRTWLVLPLSQPSRLRRRHCRSRRIPIAPSWLLDVSRSTTPERSPGRGSRLHLEEGAVSGIPSMLVSKPASRPPLSTPVLSDRLCSLIVPVVRLGCAARNGGRGRSGPSADRSRRGRPLSELARSMREPRSGAMLPLSWRSDRATSFAADDCSVANAIARAVGIDSRKRSFDPNVYRGSQSHGPRPQPQDGAPRSGSPAWRRPSRLR